MKLMDEVLSKDNLNQAFLQATRNKGASGVDEMTCDEVKDYLKVHGNDLINQIKSRDYDFNNENLLSISTSVDGINNANTFKYNYGLLTEINGSNKIEYIYDGNRRIAKIKLNNVDYLENLYEENKDGTIITTYKAEEKIINVTKNNKPIYQRILNNEGELEVNYSYDEKGIRNKKIINNEETTYILNNNQILQMSNTKGKFNFRYVLNKLVGFDYTSSSGTKSYLYITNILGDITSIIDSEGNIICSYIYDAFGNHIVLNQENKVDLDLNSIGHINPFRYRGYYFDEETGLFLVSSRYYDPETGRFISPDDISYLDPESIGGLNLYAYCLNNPVMYADPTGHFAISTFLISLAIGTFISWELSEILGSQIAGGISSTVSGGAAIYTGIGLLSFGPVGWIAGGALILIGAGTMAFGVNEMVAGATGTNYIQSWTGMSDGLYNGLYIGLNIASDI